MQKYKLFTKYLLKITIHFGKLADASFRRNEQSFPVLHLLYCKNIRISGFIIFLLVYLLNYGEEV